MTTQPGWEPRSGPTRGETARPAPRGAAGGWPDDPARRRTGGPARIEGPTGPGRAEPRTRDPLNGSGWGGPDDRGRGGPRPPREPRERAGDGPSGRPGRSPLSWIGALSTRDAMLALVAGTVMGIIATLVAGTEPGFLLSFFIIVGAIVGTLGVRPGSVYLFFPLPAFAFFLGAVITGKIHDSTLSSSAAGLAAGFTQWIAGIFLPMCAATILVLLIGGARWVLSRQLVGGQFTMSADRPAASRGPRPRPGQDPDPDPRQDADRWTDPRAARNRAGKPAPWSDPDGAGPARPARRDRDPWNDPRPSSDPRTGANPRTPADPRTAADRRPPSRNVPPVAPPARNVPPSRNVPPVPPASRNVPPTVPPSRNVPPVAPPGRNVPQPGFTPRPAAPPRPGPSRPARPPQDQWDQR